MTGRYFRAGTVAVLLVACGGQTAADHETLGDRAYAERDFGGALVEYRLKIAQESDNESLRFKAGAAALAARDLKAAAEEYSALLRLDPDNRDAFEGVDRVARAAVEEGNREALNIALEAMIQSGARTLGRYALELASGFGSATPTSQALAVLPSAAAAATDSRTQDSLIFEYAAVLRRSGNCGRAVPVFEGLVRRDHERSAEAGRQLAACALRAGSREMQLGHPQEAVRWFERAIVGGGASPSVLAAYLGLGDALFSQGDFEGASGAFLSILDRGAPGDSIYRLAAQRLNAIGDAATGAEKEEF